MYTVPQDKQDKFDLITLCDEYLSKQTNSAIRFFTRLSKPGTNSSNRTNGAKFSSSLPSNFWYTEDAIGKNEFKMLIDNLAATCGLPKDSYERLMPCETRDEDDGDDDNDDNFRFQRTVRRRSSNNTTKLKADDISNIDKLILKAKNVDLSSNPRDLLSVLLWQFKTTFIARGWNELLELERHQVKILSSPQRIEVIMPDSSNEFTVSYTKQACENKDNPMCVVKLSEMYMSQLHPASSRFFNLPKEYCQSLDKVKFKKEQVRLRQMLMYLNELSKKCGFSFKECKDEEYQGVREQFISYGVSIAKTRTASDKMMITGDGGLKKDSFLSLLGGDGSNNSDKSDHEEEPDSFLV
eukprot:CAMPEP_0172484398 /NCGR_PEP_ID=MMETSP1066-20121228/11862_1 /TAXON_ID=671091 /ORGANISM="Coscinodiscus wailesii, Strain CCMP2513" /LENGTH=352 /DNA_ID=CAMNT_0013248901 /DNA_START=156 /DNA_END=1214 /DNA_ORIENTATION=+